MAKVPPQSRALKVAVVAFDGMTPFHLSVPCLIFGAVLDAPRAQTFEVLVCSANDAPLRTSASFSIATEFGLAAIDDADIVIMPA